MNKLQVFLLACMLFVLVPPGAGVAQQESGPDEVEEYLAELNLDSLVIEHLQQRLDRPADRQVHLAIARRLTKLYSKSIFSGAQNAQTKKQLDEILRLSTDFLEIASPELKMTVLHSEYADTERQFLIWLDEGRDPQVQRDLAERFRKLGGRLQKQINQLKNEIFEGSDARLFSQAHYLYGWVAYYLGILKTEEQLTWMARSENSFREFLEIDPDKPINKFSSQWFEVQSPWHARAQIGLAMALEALGKKVQSRFCFEILESAETDSAVRDHLDVWRLNSLVYLGEMERALAFLRQRTSDDQQDIQLRTRLWVASVEAASTCEGGMYSKMGVQFLRFGLHGLVADLNASVLQDVVQRESLNLAGEDFLLAWCRGYLEFYQGETSKSKRNFDSARKELEWAIRSANPSTDVQDLAKCRFLLGWIDFQLQDFQNAVESLHQSIPELAQHDVRLASEAQWLVVRSLQMLAQSDPRYTNEVFNEMDKLVRTFPNSKYVRRVEFEKLILEMASFPPQEAIRRLKKIQKDDPNYSESIFQQIILLHRIWRACWGEAEPDSQVALRRLQDTENMFQQLYPAPAKLRRAKASLIVMDALIQTGGESLSSAKRKGSQVDELLRLEDPVSTLNSELQYFRFQLARAEDDIIQMKQVAVWFFGKNPNSKYTQSVLVKLAQATQQQFDNIEQPQREDLERLVDAYQQLCDLLGTDLVQLENSQNARFSAAKLAEYQTQAGQYADAEETVHQLLQVFPNRKDYWLLFSRIKSRTGKHKEALNGWRKIVSSTTSGTDQWYEAKIGIIRCLATTDELAAASLLTQTLNLAPKRPKRWENEINELAKSLGVDVNDSEGGK